jgi:hypothetical protein
VNLPRTTRDLRWPSCLNVRDLGGLPTLDGGVIKAGAFIRADALNRLTDEGLVAARAAGVSRIIDLRRHGEAGTGSHPFAGDPVYRNIPVQNPADPDHQWLTLAGIYCAMLDLRPDLFAEAFCAIADAPAGAVVVHCAGGKDRTGIITALALAVAGVADDVIAADYSLSQERLREDSRAQLDAIDDPRIREIAAGLMPTPPEVMVETLTHLHERHGGVRNYLISAGVSGAALTAVRDRLIG